MISTTWVRASVTHPGPGSLPKFFPKPPQCVRSEVVFLVAIYVLLLKLAGVEVLSDSGI